jgi:hypothetical protein
MKQVQVRAVKDYDGFIQWVKEDKADAFGIYVSEREGFNWLADFKLKDSALQYAAGYAEAIGAEVSNLIGVL